MTPTSSVDKVFNQKQDNIDIILYGMPKQLKNMEKKDILKFRITHVIPEEL